MNPLRLPADSPLLRQLTKGATLPVGTPKESARTRKPVAEPTDRSRFCPHLLNPRGELVGGVTAYPTENGYACGACR